MQAHQPSPNEIRDLVAIADRDIAAARTPGLHNDWSFNIAYNAALQIATAALAAAGYKAERMNHHYRVIDSLSETLGTDSKTVAMFDLFRKKRNASDYERAGAVSDRDVEAMRELAEKLRKEFIPWIEKEHPDLLAKKKK